MKFFVYISILLFSCSNKPISTGAPGEIMVYTSESDKMIISQYINKLFDNYFYSTPSIENEFIVKFKTPQDFVLYPHASNILLVSISESPDTTIDNLVNRFTEGYDTDNNILSVDDYYSMNQCIIILEAESENEFANILFNNESFIIDKYRFNTNSLISHNMYKAGKNSDIINLMKERYSAIIPVQKDYTIINNSDSLLWIGRAYPYRWIVMYEDYKKYYLDKNDAYNRINIMTSDILEINYNDLKNEYIKKNINNVECRIIRTLYEHAESETGGPSIYYIYPKNNSRVIVMGGFVNYPGHRKIDHIRQIEYIFENIELTGEKDG